MLAQRLLLGEEVAQSWGTGSGGRVGGGVVLEGNGKNKSACAGLRTSQMWLLQACWCSGFLEESCLSEQPSCAL